MVYKRLALIAPVPDADSPNLMRPRDQLGPLVVQISTPGMPEADLSALVGKGGREVAIHDLLGVDLLQASVEDALQGISLFVVSEA